MIRLAGSMIGRAALVLACLAHVGAADEPRPNIILIVADDLGYGHLGRYGQTKIRTPHIDRMAAEGITFTHFYSGCAVCAPSRSVLMTGLHMGHTPIRWNGGGTSLADKDVTIAEVLRSAGYVCGGFGKWGLGVENSPGHPMRQGFDHFFGYLHQVHAHFFYPYWLWSDESRHALSGNEGGRRGQYSHDEIMREALDFIRQNHERPFFCYLPATLPHVELAVPEDSVAPYRGEFSEIVLDDPREGYIDPAEPLATFAGMISRLDDGVGRVLALIRELGLDERTLVMFTSDNGAQGDTWRPLIDFFDGTAGLRANKGTLYEGGIRVPMVARWPRKIAANRVSDLQATFCDVLPTLAEVAGAAPPDGIDGVSLLPTLLGHEDQKRHEYLYWEHYLGTSGAAPMIQAVRAGDWMLVRPKASAAWELYDLSADPAEKVDLASRRPDVVERLAAYAESAHQPPREHADDAPRTTYRDYVR